MSDQSPGPLEARQRYTHPHEAIETHLDGRQAQIHTGMPGHIVSYDAVAMTAVVQPAIQGMHRQIDRSRKPVDIHPIHDVPVHFPSGGGFSLTFPVKPGDECWIAFAERAIDNWHQHGGIQAPSDLRKHDITDCVVHVGLRSQPNVLPGGTHPENVQLRSDDGATLIEIAGGGIVKIVAPTELQIDTPLVRVTGDVLAGTVSLRTHVNTNVQTGIDNTGPPLP